MTDFERKSFGTFEIKNETTGEVSAIVATLGVVDRDRDVLLAGSIPANAKVQLSAYGHDIIKEGASPVGKGTLNVQGDKVVFTGKFFISTTRGADAFYTLKELGDSAEWSFGWPIASVKTAPMTEEWRAKGARRLITGLSPLEASPVFQGAGLGTGTLYTKDADDPIIPDPAIEVARIETERKEKAEAEVLRLETERKEKELSRVNEDADRLFARRIA